MNTSFSNPMQVTISVLPASLSLVHIPRSRLAQLSHPVLRQILQPNPAFLNITCNEIELSLFAEHAILQDFEPIARRDRQRHRPRSGSGSGRKFASTSSVEPVEVSYEKWNVLQIDSHSEQFDNSGARVHELSAPLAAAGISILYQSSYMSDFIFVKESRLQEALTLFASAGFNLYSSDTNVLTSTISSPSSTDDRASVLDLSPERTRESGAVLTRQRSGTDTSLSFLTPFSEKSSTKKGDKRDDQRNSSPPPLVNVTPTPPLPRTKSHSPTSGEVNVLSPDLTCVGLSDDCIDTWALKIVKLVAFPDLIPSAPTHPTLTETPFDNLTSRQVNTPSFEPFSGLSSPITRRRLSTSSSSSSSSTDEVGYFSHSPSRNNSSTSLVTSASRSYNDLSKLTNIATPGLTQPSKHILSAVSPLLPVTPTSTTRSRLNIVTDLTPPRKQRDINGISRVPFFSFTRTPEGSSLTTDVSLLATLFPPHERHMVICSGELDASDDREANAGADSADDDDDDDGTLKCLQIDLRRFGLDKHGLVNRFSRVLEENRINHMYSSTFKTANLLVDRRHAARAQALLRSC